MALLAAMLTEEPKLTPTIAGASEDAVETAIVLLALTLAIGVGDVAVAEFTAILTFSEIEQDTDGAVADAVDNPMFTLALAETPTLNESAAANNKPTNPVEPPVAFALTAGAVASAVFTSTTGAANAIFITLYEVAVEADDVILTSFPSPYVADGAVAVAVDRDALVETLTDTDGADVFAVAMNAPIEVEALAVSATDKRLAVPVLTPIVI